jgi:antitoxin component of RelBE/YafQ-DinJ toxin-antitoxin module
MNKTVLQIPMNQDLKISAEQEALSQGFSSLQELVRVFLSKIAAHKIEVTLQESTMLSEKNEKRYLDMTKDFELGKNTHSSNSVSDLVNKLHGNSVS